MENEKNTKSKEKKVKKKKPTKKIENDLDLKTEEISILPSEKDYTESVFDGRVSQYIGWILLGIIISIGTVGLGIPFLICFILDWQFKHTKINNKELAFDGNGLQLLGKMLLWIFLSIITFGIYLIFVPISYHKWLNKHLHYKENIKPLINNSKFSGNTWDLIGFKLYQYIINTLSFGLLYPFTETMLINFYITHYKIDNDELEFDGKTYQLYLLYIKWIICSILTLGIYAIIAIPVDRTRWITKHTNIKGQGKRRVFNPYIAWIFPVLVSLGSLLLLGYGYYNLSDTEKDNIKNHITYIEDNIKDIDSIDDIKNLITFKDYDNKESNSKLALYLNDNIDSNATIYVLDNYLVVEDSNCYVINIEDIDNIKISNKIENGKLQILKNNNDLKYTIYRDDKFYRYYYFLDSLFASFYNSNGDIKVELVNKEDYLNKLNYIEEENKLVSVNIKDRDYSELEKILKDNNIKID